MGDVDAVHDLDVIGDVGDVGRDRNDGAWNSPWRVDIMWIINMITVDVPWRVNNDIITVDIMTEDRGDHEGRHDRLFQS